MPKTAETKLPEVLEGVTLSRTLAPALPNNLISRKRLFNLLSEKKPGATLVVAPTGYGKTAFVAEWAQQSKSKVIWTQLSEKDSLLQLSLHMIQSVKNVVPNFAPWSGSIKDFSIEEVIRKTANDIYSLKEDFVWVLDSAEELNPEFTDVRRIFIESIPQNVHVILISRKSPDASYARFASLGNLNLINSQQLLFNLDEVETIANLAELNLDDSSIRSALESAQGWPAAVQLLIRKIQSGKSELSLKEEIYNKSDPIRFLTEAIIETIDSEDIDSLTFLSLVDEFDFEIAEILLGNASSPQLFARMSADGLFVSSNSSHRRVYQLNPLIRETLRERFTKLENYQLSIHSKLSNYYMNQGKVGLALSHAHQSGDRDLLLRILKQNIRIMAATGKGDFLLEWSKIIGDSTIGGRARRLSLQIAAHVVNLEFDLALALNQELLSIVGNLDAEVFLRKSSCVSTSTINFFNGNLTKVVDEAEYVLSRTPNVRDVENIDKLHALRLLSNRALAFEDYEKCIEIYSRAQEYLSIDYAPLPTYYFNAISAAASFAEGNYLEAFDFACSGITMAELNDFKGIADSTDLHFIRARCLLEFTRTSEAIAAFDLVRKKSLLGKQKVWYILADGYLLRQLVLDGKIEQAFEGIKEQRELLTSISSTHQLDTFVDANEAFLRYIVKDFDRVLQLLDRMPDVHFVSRFKPQILERQGKKTPDNFIEDLPTKTPREKIYKYLVEIDAVLDRESEALSILRKCLDLASMYGVRETILRQKPGFLNLIIKASGDRPTVYLEELARAAASRLKQSDQNSSGIVDALTKREIEILKNLSTGKPISAIGSSLHVSQNTMKTHLRNIYRKLEADGRHTAVEKAKSLFII